jgi:hypothetical protein
MLTITVSHSISVNPPDFKKHLNSFEKHETDTFNLLVSSFLHASIKESFNDLMAFF